MKGRNNMKELINGYMYDTDKSKLIAKAYGPYIFEDERQWNEALYQTQDGKFFLKGDGGPRSKYYDNPALIPYKFWEAEIWYREQLDYVYTAYDITKAKDPDPNYNTYCRLFKDKEEAE